MKNEKNRKLHGSVLLTVVVVMSLLIVFLFGTLALATAANNRAHANYSSSQTGVTSRMVAQSAIDAMELSLPYRQAVGVLDASSGTLSVPVSIDNSGGLNTGAFGHIDDVQVSYVGQKKIYDTVKKEWVDRDLIKFTSTVTMGGVESQTSAYVLKLLDTDTVPGSGNGAALVTAAGATLSCRTSIYGGGYINIPDMNVAAEAAKYSYYKTAATPKDALPVYKKPDGSSTSTDCIEFTNNGAIAEADVYINHNVYIQDWSGFVFPEKSTGVTIWGDLGMSDNVCSHLNFEASNNIDYSNLKFNEMPYFYVDGTVHVGNAFKMGDSNNQFPLNLFCGSIKSTGDVEPFDCAADIYCMDADAKGDNANRITPKDGLASTLYSWAGSVINQTVSQVPEKHASSISAKGDLKIQSMTVNGDIRVEGDCTILKGGNDNEGKVKIGGNLIVGGTLTVAPGAKIEFFDSDGDGNIGGIYCDDVVGYNSGDASLAPKPGYTKIETIEHDGKVDESKYTKVENVQIPYLELDPTYYRHSDEWGNDDGGMDYAGNNLWGNTNRLVYTWKSGIDPTPMINLGNETSAKIAELSTTDPEYSEKVFSLWNNFYVQAAGYIDETIAPFGVWEYPDDTHKYTVKTYLTDPADPNSDKYILAEPTTSQYSYYDPATGTPVYDQEPYRTLPEYDSTADEFIDSGVVTTKEYLWYKDSNPSVWVAEKDVYGDSLGIMTINQFYTDYKTTQVYPQYAERRVLLGLDKLPSSDGTGMLSTDSTKVITRLDEIQNKIDDPYKNRGVPAAFTDDYTALKNNGPVLSSTVDVLTAMDGKYASSIGGAGGAYYQISTDTMSEIDTNNINNSITNVDGAALYIDKNCILDFGMSNDLVINPGSGNLFIIVKNFSINAGCNLIVDDSQGGTVTFYIDSTTADPATFTHNGNASFATISYMNLFRHFDGEVIQYTHDPARIVKDPGTNVAYPNIAEDFTNGTFTWKKERVKPAIYIYGGDAAKLSIQNIKLGTFNVLSPDMSVETGGGTPEEVPSKFYYNGYNIFNPFNNASNPTDGNKFIMGCVNSNNVDFKNPLQVLYTTDGGGLYTPPPPPTGDFTYTVLYYDEY